ncbi:MAG: hypothetical protein QM569_04100 [Acidovorax sp.]|uniref:hypothetical protein n=1 Tax=Acidovorax sp. TaxID=1872122 RepID=UPI0039E64C55
MRFNSEVIVHGIKASKGVMETAEGSRPYDSTTFHCEVDIAESSSGPSIGKATRPFKCGNATEFDKWAHLGNSLPIKAMAVFEMATSGEGTKMVMVEIKPIEQAKAQKAA